MVSIRSVLRTIPDPRGKKGRLHWLDAILSLILLSMLSGRKGMKGPFIRVAVCRASISTGWISAGIASLRAMRH